MPWLIEEAPIIIIIVAKGQKNGQPMFQKSVVFESLQPVFVLLSGGLEGRRVLLLRHRLEVHIGELVCKSEARQ